MAGIAVGYFGDRSRVREGKHEKMAKKTRKELLKSEDAFIQAANQSAQWFNDNKGRVIVGSVLSFLLIAGLWSGVEYSKANDRAASAMLEQALKIADANVDERGSTKAAGSDEQLYPSEQEKYQAFKEALTKLKAEHSGRGAGALASFYLSEALLELEDREGARTALDELIRTLNPEDPLWALALERGRLLERSPGRDRSCLGVDRSIKKQTAAVLLRGLSFLPQSTFACRKRGQIPSTSALRTASTGLPRVGIARSSQDPPECGACKNNRHRGRKKRQRI